MRTPNGMKTKKLPCWGGAAALLFLALAAPPAWGKIGLAARFGDVILEGAQPGKTYNLRETTRVPFAVENRGDNEVEIVVEFLLPRKNDLSEGYESVPDPGWFKALPDKMRVGPKGMAYFDIVLAVPGDAPMGKHYQALVKARSSGSGMFGLAVENKIRVSIGPGPEGLAAEKKKKAMQKLDFDVKPQAIYLSGIAAGKPYDVKKEAQKTIRAANYGPEPLALKFESSAWDGRFTMPDGYEPIPDPSWIAFKSPELTVAPDEIGQLPFFVKVPAGETHRGKKYAAVIRTGLSTGFWLDAPVRVFLEIKP